MHYVLMDLEKKARKGARRGTVVLYEEAGSGRERCKGW